MNKKVLITGGSGFIGTHLSPVLKSKGYEPVFLTTGKRREINGIKAFHWNPSIHQMDSEALDGVSVIIHLAGATLSKRWTPSYKQVIVDSRINGLQTLKQALERKGDKVTHILSASGIAIYPESKDNPVREDHEPGAGFLAEVCKLWELYADHLTPHTERLTKIRIGYVLDNKQGGLKPLITLAKTGLISPNGSGNQMMSWIHIDDLVRMILFLLENGETGVYNAVAPTPVTNREFMKTLAQTLNRPSFLPAIPSGVFKAILGEMLQTSAYQPEHKCG